jgi:hypothetical protein
MNWIGFPWHLLVNIPLQKICTPPHMYNQKQVSNLDAIILFDFNLCTKVTLKLWSLMEINVMEKAFF